MPAALVSDDCCATPVNSPRLLSLSYNYVFWWFGSGCIMIICISIVESLKWIF